MAGGEKCCLCKGVSIFVRAMQVTVLICFFVPVPYRTACRSEGKLQSALACGKNDGRP
jgi:hypothetical protein